MHPPLLDYCGHDEIPGVSRGERIKVMENTLPVSDSQDQESGERDWQPAIIAPASNSLKYHHRPGRRQDKWEKCQGLKIFVRPTDLPNTWGCPRSFAVRPDFNAVLGYEWANILIVCEHQIQTD
jgi:hypothetical protein